MWRQFIEVFQYREMLLNLVAKELRARYKRSTLGFLWTFVNPLLMIIVYSLVFSFVMRTRQEHYGIFLFVGLLPWNWTAQSAIQGAASLVQNANLVKKVYFPRIVLPLAVVVANLVNYVLSLFVLVPALILAGSHPTSALLAFPAIVAVQALFVTGLAVLAAIGNVYFRDLEHIVGVFMNAWFFLTPVFYGAELVPDRWRPLFALNPMVHLLEGYRSIFLLGNWPDWRSLGTVAAVVLVFCAAGLAVFARAQRGAAEYL
jgi:lipopolysaccharide transport system permease protein